MVARGHSAQTPVSSLMAGGRRAHGRRRPQTALAHGGGWAISSTVARELLTIGLEGKSFVADVKGDLWYFPTGIPHSIRIEPGWRQVLLVFDDGNFSEFAHRLVSRLDGHTEGFLARPRCSSIGTLSQLPRKKSFSSFRKFDSPAPWVIRMPPPRNRTPLDFAFRTLQLPVTNRTRGGEVRIVDSSQFKVSKNIAAAIVTVHPGGIRELHWHQNADEWQYCAKREDDRVRLHRGTRANHGLRDLETWDTFSRHSPHYVENTGNTDLKMRKCFATQPSSTGSFPL